MGVKSVTPVLNVSDIGASFAWFESLGWQRGFSYPPTDEPWGIREFHLRHPDGHMFRVGSALD